MTFQFNSGQQRPVHLAAIVVLAFAMLLAASCIEEWFAPTGAVAPLPPLPTHTIPPESSSQELPPSQPTVTVQAVPALHDIPAFPGAMGYGAGSVGGRGGQVIFVTNLNDEGPGSLRACAETSGPRTCVFRTGGTIVLQSRIVIDEPYLTIAGQSAPGDGILLRAPNDTARQLLYITTHDVIVRYLRFRPGKGEERCGQSGGNVCQRDAVGIGPGASNVILDHITAMWANDEAISGQTSSRAGIHRITVQHSILGEVFDAHPTSSLWAGKEYEERHPLSHLTIHHNVFVHSGHRTPLFNHVQRGQVINNVIYNWDSFATVVQEGAELDLIGNYYIPGPATGLGRDSWLLRALQADNATPSVYMEGNVNSAQPGMTTEAGWNFTRGVDLRPFPDTWRRATPFHLTEEAPAFPVLIEPHDHLFQRLVSSDGNAPDGDVGMWRRLDCAGGWVTVRDAIDLDALQDVVSRQMLSSETRSYPNHQDGYGGYPTIAPGTPCPDQDQDGMPDEWERQFNLDANDATDSQLDADNDGYTNLEEYLNGSHPR